jgi:hypothetical protein
VATASARRKQILRNGFQPATAWTRRDSAIDNDELSIDNAAIIRNTFGSFDVIFTIQCFSNPHSGRMAHKYAEGQRGAGIGERYATKKVMPR